ncbi:DEAD/DEAH box helicase [Nocardioides zeae]|uniref:ATP-dependent RNA helicase HelY n=1 Tax=Nocardioides zeae TaxID=1457234 RepID=A0AAJ1TXI2_9ACTN|nr:DEAD/DEAH box helicase [Nocardioides zeae]MDQ1104146.1 ATP-dependent RNA helicase HelY [Nocardioides zeae]
MTDRSDTAEPSAAERYAAFRKSQSHPLLHDFAAGFSFGLDDFQLRACRELEDGRGVLVAAPTGSGKTVVGEFAVHLALAEGRKCFYTTPIKALSNQKYNDLVDRYGADRVGLLTGDNAVNGEAPIVVMTTEVLRNMIYAGSRTLSELGYVVMDEVHYLADRNRGAVWEEVIIHLPESVVVVSLSATVSNAEEFGEWLATVRGDTTTIVEERRPVPLFQHVIVGRQLHDLFARSDEAASAGFAGDGAKVNPHLLKIARDDWASSRIRDRRTPKGQRHGGSQGRGGAGRGRDVGNGRRMWIPSRAEVVQRLDREGLLPAITFIFSRAGCDAAVSQCLDADLWLTDAEEQKEIRAYVEERCADLPRADRQVLGYATFLEGLTRGVAAHHAGMLPTFKECVEELFVRGLVRAVFATETLALGINMPARTVVLEKLVKWNGEAHADITPGEYTQLTGRAGRRGLDVEGHAVVVWQQGMNPTDVAGLASTRTYPLRSSFRPSYNMAVNLVHRFGRDRSRQLLESSFAQFQADKAVVGLARQLHKSDEALAGYAEAATCDRGDFMEYAALRRRVSEAEKEGSRARRSDRREDVVGSLTRLKVGDVIKVPGGKFAGWAVVTDPGLGRDEPRPSVVTVGRQSRRLGLIDFPEPVRAASRIRMPKNFDGRNPQQRRDLAAYLTNHVRDLPPPPPVEPAREGRSGRAGGTAGADGHGTGPERVAAEVERLRAEMKAHPCHSCPDRETHARWAERWFKLDREATTLRRRIESRTNTIARQFDRVSDVLKALDYLDGETVTDRGRALMRIYSELDLVAAEALRLGAWEGLDAPDLAAALSVLVFEARRTDDGRGPRLPSAKVSEAVSLTRRLWADLSVLEKHHKLDQLREPDAGFAWAAHAWARGDDLDDILRATGMPAGDFVRVVKQLLDVTDQIAAATTSTTLRRTAREAGDLLNRGIVAYTTVAAEI